MTTIRKIGLKVCGLRDAGNIMEVGLLHPDYMGFIFFRGSPRFVGDDFGIPADLPRDVKRVGVFVNENFNKILELSGKHALDLVQLHGTESPALCAEIRRHGIEVIKAIPMHEDFDFGDLVPFEHEVDYFLFDTKGPLHGGNGVRFDWNMLRRYTLEVPFFLSGGLSPKIADSIREISMQRLHALDVNSGVEKSVGLKDLDLVKKMMEF